tara:strand:- start:2635 stop:3612 length:978 start_codon:yes stop_codon:yes gene_type:complete
MNILFVLSGGTFRQKLYDEKQMIKRQIVTTLSHLHLINKINDKLNLQVKILFNLKKNDKNKYIYNILHKFILQKNEYESVSSEFELIENTMNILENIQLNKNNIEYIFFLRPDVYLKNYFIENFKINTNKIIYTHIDKNGRNWVKGAYYPYEYFPSVWHGIVLIPKKFFQYINSNQLPNIVEKCSLPSEKYLQHLLHQGQHILHPTDFKIRNHKYTHSIWFYHRSANNFMKLVNNNNLIDFFDNNLYLCSTECDWNPMYLNNDRHVVKSTPNNILTFQRINSNEIKIYEINNSKNKELLKNEEDFEKIVNDLDISLYSKINLVNP